MDASSVLGLVALSVALTSLVVNYLLLREQHDPQVIVYAIADKRRPSVINLVIKNIGRGVAHNVVFESSEPIPEKAFGFDGAKVPDAMKSGPFVTGIPMLHPEESRILTWGQYGGLKAAGLSERDLFVTAIYRSKPRLRLTDGMHKSVSVISVKSFESTDASDHNYDKKIAERLSDLVNIANRLVGYDRAVHVKVLPDDEPQT
jgi:hypothetical protein